MSLKDICYPACLPCFASKLPCLLLLTQWKFDRVHFAIRLKDSHKLIGHIAVKPDSEEDREDTRELGYALNPKYQHRGYMTEAVKAVMDYLFENEKIKYIWACCFTDNAASKKLIDNCGFSLKSMGRIYSEATKSEEDTYECIIDRDKFEDICKH